MVTYVSGDVVCSLPVLSERSNTVAVLLDMVVLLSGCGLDSSPIVLERERREREEREREERERERGEREKDKREGERGNHTQTHTLFPL